MTRRHVALFTGNRAEYTLQYPIFRAIAKDSRLQYTLLIGGTHLNQEYGRTISEIEQDGFRATPLSPVEISEDLPAYTPLSISSLRYTNKRTGSKHRADHFRSPLLGHKVDGKWVLRHKAYSLGRNR
jgi:UDP-N-acetylglucosamine 2-epimerase (non-hydrolysing)/GDP/UDP-N,N'-diacetylbacillosamine 2-epimerase (hydrolysing)